MGFVGHRSTVRPRILKFFRVIRGFRGHLGGLRFRVIRVFRGDFCFDQLTLFQPLPIMRKACLLPALLLLPLSAFAEGPAPVPTPSAAPAPKILYVGAITINACQDAKILADWYARLGIATKQYQGEYFAKIETAAGVVAFGIHPKKADAPQKSSASVAVVFRVDNFDAYLAALKAKGLSPESVEKDPFGQYAHFHDPDGNEVALWGR